jgi:hypothetical protein
MESLFYLPGHRQRRPPIQANGIQNLSMAVLERLSSGQECATAKELPLGRHIVGIICLD